MADKIFKSVTLPDGADVYINNPESTAEQFSASKAYTAGEMVFYNRKLYKFTADHAAGAWNAAHAAEVTVGSEMADIRSDVTDLMADITKKPDYIHDSASGAIASFPDGADGQPIQSLVAQIEPVQDLHGYDAPWPAGGGKNKLPVYADGSSTSASCTIHTNADGSVTITGTSSGQPVAWLANDGTFKSGGMSTVGMLLALNGTYALSGSSDSPFLRIDICDESGNFVRVGDGEVTLNGNYYVRIVGNNGVSYNTTIKPMIRLASVSDATFAPYSNISPITGWTGLSGVRTGKNLAESVYTDVATAQYAAALNIEADLKPSTTYTISFVGTAGNVLYVNEKIFNYLMINVTGQRQSVTVTTKSTVDRSKGGHYTPTRGWTIFKNNQAQANANTFTDVQLELGSTATTYEPYTGQPISVSWETEAGTVYGGSVDVVSGVLTVDRGYIASYNGETLPSTWISDRDVYAEGTTPTTGAQVVYELATPQTYQLTPQEVATLLGTNNISVDTGNVSVTYSANTKLYIDKKIAELASS